MKTIRYKSRGEAVHVLEQILAKLGYDVKVSSYFGTDTQRAILRFQRENNLVVDGIVGMKTWSVLLEAEKHFVAFNDKFLSEEDLEEFAKQYVLDLAAVKAVNEVESSGKGFLVYGRPQILFEGHVFWRELEDRGINPKDFVSQRTKDILYPRWTKEHYRGGSGEYDRLEKAAGLSDNPAFHDAAYCSASWGSFQIMGFHFQKLGYASIDHFVSEMYEHEREHLKAFGKFLDKNNLLSKLRSMNWTEFAKGYNGSGYAKNKYDQKLEDAYDRYREMS